MDHPNKFHWEFEPSQQSPPWLEFYTTTKPRNDSYTIRIKLRSNSLIQSKWPKYVCSCPVPISSIVTRERHWPVVSSNRIYTLTNIGNLETWLGLSRKRLTPWVPISLCTPFSNLRQVNSFANEPIQPFALLSFHQNLTAACDFHGSTSSKILAPNGIHPAKWN